jgi:hypothetical protein
VTEPAPHPYRWTLDEYVLRCAIDSTVREVLVESELDMQFFAEVLHRGGIEGVTIFDADYIDLSDDAVRDAGYASGAKGRLLAVGAGLVAESERIGGLVGTVVIVVDRNFDDVPDALRMYVFATDGYSVENYSLNERSVDRFIGHVLGRAPSPAGASGATRARRTTVTGAEILRRVRPPSIDVSAARRFLWLFHSDVRLVDGWLRYFRFDSDGNPESNMPSLLANSMTNAARNPAAISMEAVDAERTNVQRDHRLIRGRDYVDLFHLLLRSPWGKRRAGKINFALVQAHDFRRWLTLMADPVEVDALPLPRQLVARFTRANGQAGSRAS